MVTGPLCKRKGSVPFVVVPAANINGDVRVPPAKLALTVKSPLPRIDAPLIDFFVSNFS